jgi:hypothetical protein
MVFQVISLRLMLLNLNLCYKSDNPIKIWLTLNLVSDILASMFVQSYERKWNVLINQITAFSVYPDIAYALASS